MAKKKQAEPQVPNDRSTIKITVYASTNKVGSRNETSFEVDRDDLPENPAEREAAINDMAKDAMWDLIEWGWEVADND